MRLTVGPLPAAIYWRRRLLVLGVLALIAIVLTYALAGGAEPGPDDPLGSATTDPSGMSETSPATASETSSPTPTAYVVPVNTATGGVPTGPATAAGRCTDSEIELTAQRRAPLPSETHRLTLILKIKNVSSRYCVRDIGSAPQELRLRAGEVVVWSSDDCSTQSPYHQDWTFPPGSERTFEIKWDGYRTRDVTGVPSTACEKTPANRVGVGSYQLVARLDAIYYTSEPFSLVS